MDQNNIEEYVARYFSDKIPQVDMTSSFKDLKVDSLDLVEFVMHIEETFGLEIDANEIDENGGLGQFCDLVKRALDARQPA